MIKRLVPYKIKRSIRILQRNLNDRKTGIKQNLAKKSATSIDNLDVICKEIIQPIYYNPLSANKVANIRLAKRVLEETTLLPGQIFSFWHLVGNPTVKQGYQTGRNIIGNSLKEDVGGGLCQLSGIIYHLALLTGLEIVERHCHTLDLYEEDQRFTPLGTDATVVFGYKDLRFKNSTNQPIQFSFAVMDDSFSAQLRSTSQLPLCELRFERTDYPKKRELKTFRIRANQEEFVNLSIYRLFEP